MSKASKQEAKLHKLEIQDLTELYKGVRSVADQQRTTIKSLEGDLKQLRRVTREKNEILKEQEAVLEKLDTLKLKLRQQGIHPGSL